MWEISIICGLKMDGPLGVLPYTLVTLPIKLPFFSYIFSFFF